MATSDSPIPPTKPSASRRLPPWLSLLLRVTASVALMAYALRGVPWDSLANQLKRADWRWWIAGLVTTMLVQGVAALRWAALARPIGFPFRLRFFVWRFFEGMFFSLCLPSSIGGDVIKAFRVGDTTQRRLLAGCTILADRLTGLAALGVLVGTALIATKYSLGVPATLAVGVGLLAAALAGFALGVGSLDRLLELIPAPHPARAFIAQLLPYQQRPSLMAQAVGWSLIVQMGGAVSVALIARALGVEQPMQVWFSVVPLIALAMVLPVSINGVGVREGGLEMLLAPHGVAAAQAVAVGLLWLLSTIIAGLIGGVMFLLDRDPTAPAGEPVEVA
jgi:glycosyltransferase 2 family protein